MSRRFGRDACCDFESAQRREWLVTNGIGGYASGTIAFALTRRYHGLLVAALAPPTSRTLLVPKFDETATYRGTAYPLSSNRWADGTISPAGHLNIESFELDGTAPVWRYAIADAVIERRIWMPYGRNAACVRYTVERATGPVELVVDAFVDWRDHHTATRAHDNEFRIEATGDGFDFVPSALGIGCAVRCPEMAWTVDPSWYYGFALERERERGLEAADDHLRAARGRATLHEGASCTVEIQTELGSDAAADPSWAAFEARQEGLRGRWRGARDEIAGPAPDWIEELVTAADQFVVKRGDGATVIAGYPWFADWGRDTMISLPGLALVTGRPEIARSMLLTFARFVDRGMIPNRFPDSGERPEYNTVDGSLWYFVAVSEYLERTGDGSLAVELHATLADIVEWHLRGTRHGIRCDPADGLIAAGEPGVQLTWMDAKVGDVVVTPRIGKPVEVNALWLNALHTMAVVADAAGRPRAAYDELSAAARSGFERFWNSSAGHCYDVLDGPDGHDASLRPNQIFAVSLPETALSQDQRRGVVDACARALLASYGLRSLTCTDPRYRGVYGGDPGARDGAYHQGTVLGYLLGQFAIAHHRVYGDPKRALAFLEPMRDASTAYCVGTLGEIFDGDPPFRPKGAIAQAWTVAETLRAWRVISTEAAK